MQVFQYTTYSTDGERTRAQKVEVTVYAVQFWKPKVENKFLDLSIGLVFHGFRAQLGLKVTVSDQTGFLVLIQDGNKSNRNNTTRLG